MTKERMIELLEIEHSCMLRASHNSCDRKCDSCELCQSDDELHEMYTNIIKFIKEQQEAALCKNSKNILSYRDEDEHVYNKAKELIGEENILQYRPTVISGNPDTMFDFEAFIPDTITIWLKNGDTIMYRSNN